MISIWASCSRVTNNDYNLEIIKVVDDGKSKTDLKEAFTGEGKLVNSEFLNGLDVASAKDKQTLLKHKHYLKKREQSRTQSWCKYIKDSSAMALLPCIAEPF